MRSHDACMQAGCIFIAMITPRFVTPRFTLREIKDEDEEQLFSLRSDDLVHQFLNRPIATSMNDVRQWREKVQQGAAKNEAIMWAIDLNDLLIGTICLWNISWQDARAEIGYDLLPEYHGQGVMQEIIPVVLRFGFEELKMNSIVASIHPGNIKSIRLVEKLGFTLQPHPEAGETSDLYFCIQK